MQNLKSVARAISRDMTGEEHDYELYIETANAAIDAYESRWMKSKLPQQFTEGVEVTIRFEKVLRYHFYRPNSQQFRKGIKGRWQQMNEYGGWDNMDVSSEDTYEWRV